MVFQSSTSHVNNCFGLIDTLGNLNYDSGMNYWYSHLLVDYSYDESSDDDFDDWAAVDLASILERDCGDGAKKSRYCN